MRLATVVATSIVLALVTGAAAQVRDEAAEAATDEQIAALIEQLGDRQFSVRQRAQQELRKLGFEAFDALVEAENSDDPEIAMQAGYLVRQIRAAWTADGDPQPIQQILRDYEVQNDERRLVKIKQLAALPEDKGLRWLCRLVRFERSPVLSKQAALSILSEEPPDDAAWNRRAETIHKELGRARRPAARWVDTYLQAHSDPAGALAKWSELAEAERQMLEQHPHQTHSQIAMALLRRQVELLERLGRAAETGEVMQKMVLCERGDSASLTELIDWLVGRKSWDVIDLVADRFSASFEVDAVLMYTLCEARLAQGNRELADKTAEKALKISGDSQEDHARLAERLTDRGLVRWADHEWRHVLALGPLGTQWDIIARDMLAANLHDRGLDREAADLIKQLVEAADNDPAVTQLIRTAQQLEGNLNVFRAKVSFYLSCHADAQGDAAQRRQLLEKALEQDRENVEVLIALYEVTQQEPEKRADLVKTIAEVIEQCRGHLEEQPDRPVYYNNQIAWLIANTEGDADEAIELSRKSIELARELGESPHRLGGLLDTLAHCYYAKKDYASAVKSQEEAAKLDPDTQSIRRALTRFREALAAQQSGGK
ncbi:MAG: tetratricopeptide repeat protein [Pirellulales bacterium]